MCEHFSIKIKILFGTRTQFISAQLVVYEKNIDLLLFTVKTQKYNI